MPITRWRWLSTQRLLADSLKVGSRVLDRITGVVAIPRSGVLPAAHIAAVYHLPFGIARRGGIDWTIPAGRSAMMPPPGNGPVLVIDDTLYGGMSVRRAKEWLAGVDAIYAAVFVRSHAMASDYLDLCGEEVGDRHINEWNCFNNIILRMWDGGIGLDLDGVICHDPPMNDTSHQTEYETWLLEAQPRWLPRAVVCPLILTGRLEKYRPQTEVWLASYGVRYDRLVMCPVDHPAKRGSVTVWKSEQLKAAGVGAYIESFAPHACEIARRSGLPVVCPDAEAVYDFREDC